MRLKVIWWIFSGSKRKKMGFKKILYKAVIFIFTKIENHGILCGIICFIYNNKGYFWLKIKLK